VSVGTVGPWLRSHMDWAEMPWSAKAVDMSEPIMATSYP
jgi:hypothetical protein